eukprot:SAG31_NODE_315_length_17848_cov_18.145811_2_plen_226_part_00
MHQAVAMALHKLPAVRAEAASRVARYLLSQYKLAQMQADAQLLREPDSPRVPSMETSADDSDQKTMIVDVGAKLRASMLDRACHAADCLPAEPAAAEHVDDAESSQSETQDSTKGKIEPVDCPLKHSSYSTGSKSVEDMGEDKSCADAGVAAEVQEPEGSDSCEASSTNTTLVRPVEEAMEPADEPEAESAPALKSVNEALSSDYIPQAVQSIFAVSHSMPYSIS